MLLIVVLGGTPVPETPWPKTSPTVLATRVRFCVVGGGGGTDELNQTRGPVFAGGGGTNKRKFPADWPDLIDWIGNVDEFPNDTRLIRGEKCLLQPRKLRCSD